MTEVLWPPDLCPSSQTWTTIGNAATFNSPFSGTTRTYGRPGVRMGCTITLPPAKGENRARMLAVLRALKDRSNYIWVPDFTTTLETGLPVRGSFPANELFVNNNFASGATGWSRGKGTLSVADRVLRLTLTEGGIQHSIFQAPSLTAFTPYVLRGMASVPDGVATSGPYIVDGSSPAIGGGAYDSSHGALKFRAVVPGVTAPGMAFPIVLGTGACIAGGVVDLYFASLSRCMLVDNGPNALLQSDAFGTTWAGAGCTVSTNSHTAPDGTTTADSLVEADSANTEHYVHQSFTSTSSAADITFSVSVKAVTRGWCFARMIEATGATEAYAFVNLATGAVGFSGVGANWANSRAHVVAQGNGWYRVFVTARKTNAATSIQCSIGSALDNGTNPYAGSAGTVAIAVWRGSAALSSVPVRGVQTTTTATTGTVQTSNRLYVKGLPASTQNLLKAGDMVQIGGQINQLIAPLDSDAAGLGVLICGNPWRGPADNAPVIVNTPMCKMQLASDTIDIETGPGQFSPFQIELVEAIE